MRVQLLSSDSGGTNFTAPITANWWSIGNGRRAIATATEAQVSHKFQQIGQISNISCRVQSNTTTGTVTVKLRKNGADGNGTFTIGIAATGEFVDTTNTDTIAAGDLVNYQLAGGTSGAWNVRNFACVWDSYTAPYQGLANYALPVATTSYIGFSGATPGTTESALQFQTRMYSKWFNLGTYISANASSTNCTLKSRINGADGNQSVTITASTTGFFQDTTNSDNVTYNAKINHSVTGATTGTCTFLTVTSDMTYNPTYQWINENDGTTITFNVQRFGQWMGNSFTGTEAPNRFRVKQPLIIGNLNAQVSANSLNTSSTLFDRKSGASGSMLITIGSSATGYFEDTSLKDNMYLVDDTANWGYSSAGAASGSITFQNVGCTVHPLEQYVN